MTPSFNHFLNLNQIIFFTYIIATLLTFTTALLSHDEECVALFQFKQNILHQNSNAAAQKFKSWSNITTNNSGTNNGSDCCFWEGVTCSSNNKGHVIELDLSKSFFQGGPIISSNTTLFNLVYLQKLNFSMNDFSGSQIPSEISRLKELRDLDLSNSSFSGQIPHEISYLVQLTYLDLSLNPLKLQTPSLDYLLQNLTRLQVVSLSGVDISSSVPRFLANFSSLTTIAFENCDLKDEFPPAIFHPPNLKYLSLRNNTNLSGSFPEFQNTTLLLEHLDLGTTGFGGKIIPESISKLNNLVYLYLGECYFSGTIPASLNNLTHVTFISVRVNKFSGLVPSLGSLSNLTILELTSNNFDKGSDYSWIGKLTNLEKLYLSDINMEYEILPSLANLTKLSFIYLPGNSISGSIPTSFMNLTQLTYISLAQNLLHGPISSALSSFKILTHLDLAFNNFGGMLALETLSGLNKLEFLYLNNNNLSVVSTNNYTNITLLPSLKNLGLALCNLREFPAFLRFQHTMEALILRDNNINGLIPVWIWNNSVDTMEIIGLTYNLITGFHQNPRYLPWTNLQALDIAVNRVQGRLPIPPPTIAYYNMAQNNLTGEMPSSICEWKSLQLLDLSFNNMTGTVPPCLSSLSNSLLVLNLKGNNFHDIMMNEFTHGCMLNRIDLSGNQFIGQIPKSLTNCTSLEVLSLGDNSFDDVFPNWLGKLVELKVLILRSNKLHVPIRGSTIDELEFPKLRIIDLSNNGFTGQLPQTYIKSWHAMKSIYVGESVASISLGFELIGFTVSYQYSMTLTNKGVKTEYEKILNTFIAIDLSSNNFTGPIPRELQDLQGLQSLNLSNNQLSGPILPSLGNLTNLESVDLSQNALSGEIPQELLQLGFLAILNVSFNNLDGPIPQGKQFFTFQNNSYMGNPGLCGEPLSKECQRSKTPTTSNNIEYDESNQSLLPHDIFDWMIIFSGAISGFVIGLVLWNSRYTRYTDWLIDRFGLRKDTWVRPIRNTRRSN
ncbi:receptor-like protein 6 [Rutidosis leptorrhynchoides]|uniref:receptor-like protein 6 n=1 Tax=Rutidosis leptorrhynchoides TaxID=125765 RepID=UPI003A99086D